MSIFFSDGSNTDWNTYDQDGQLLVDDTTSNVWHYRRVDLSAHAGKAITGIALTMNGNRKREDWVKKEKWRR